MARFPAPSSVTRVTVLVALLCATVLVASLLAYEAYDASRSERVTVERALRDYATVAAWELQSAARKRVDAALQQAFSPVVTGTASSPYETLLPLALVMSAARPLLPCETGAVDAGRRYVRLDLRDGSATFAGAERGGADGAALIELTRNFSQADATPEQPYGLVRVARGPGAVVLAVGVKYATHGAPLAAYGFTICADALGAPLVRAVLATHPLLPSLVRGAVPNESLVAVRVTTGAGGELLRTGSVATPYAATVELDTALGMRATVGLQDAAASRLLVGRPSRSRVPMLVALLVLTAGLAGVALLQVRREHELAALRADFTSSVSHELRTPLAQILLFGETLALGRTRGDGERRLAARTIVEEARRLMRMVDNILVFSRIRRAPITPCAERVDLWRLACEVASGFEPLAAARGARVDVGAGTARGHAGVWDVAADPWLVRQILLNLLDNAVKHGREGQVVRVVLSGDAEQVRLTVDDEGPGVPAADRERIWDPYVRLPEGGGGQEGSGLGLAVVRDLAAALGGRVWVEDGARGGARFGLSLPRGLAVERGAPPAEESTPDAGPFPHHSNAPRTHSTPSQPSTT